MLIPISLFSILLALSYVLRSALFKLTAGWFKIPICFARSLLILFLADLATVPSLMILSFILTFLPIRQPGLLARVPGILLTVLVSLTVIHLFLKKYFQSNLRRSAAVYFSSYLLAILTTLSLVIPTRLFLVEPFRIAGAGMEPALGKNEHVLIVKFDRTYQRGDIVLYRLPEDQRYNVVHRIIGLPGETVQIKGGRVLINGTVLEEGLYLQGEPNTPGDVEYSLGSDDYFLLGDDRKNSRDSRNWGPIPRKLILGKVWKIRRDQSP